MCATRYAPVIRFDGPTICPLMKVCPQCKGLKVVQCSNCQGTCLVAGTACPSCRGTGRVTCNICGGSGEGLCPRYETDRQEYARLVAKWTKYAQSQPDEEIELEFKGKKERVVYDSARDVVGSQVIYLEYKKKAQERLANMCPHVKREQLGLITKEPPYLECQIFSEWYYAQKR